MINDATIRLIKEFEGLRLETYRCSAGVLTIGYGTTAAAGVGIDPKPGMRITEAEADMYFWRGLEKFAAQIRPMITAPINPNEFGAFLSLAYNIGPSAFKRSSALRKFNAGDKAGAVNAIKLWNKAGGKVLKGLERRRAAERALFLAAPAKQPATAPQLEPRKDDVPDFIPTVSAPPMAYVMAFAGVVAAIYQWGADVLDWITFWN